jgi:hypothetical protein
MAISSIPYYPLPLPPLFLVAAGKAVFAAEYTDTGVDFQAACAWRRAHIISFILKNHILTAFRNT